MAFLLLSCVSLPAGIEPVQNFQLDRYLGKWYEVARLDHRFEEGLTNVTAEYIKRSDGGLRVVNRGYAVNESTWQEAEGKAYFAREHDEGFFKVSFFGPFYGAYVIFELDEKYSHAFIAGNNRGYLWLLSRTPTVSEDVKSRFLEQATSKGFDTRGLIWVEHDRAQAGQ